MKIKRIFIGILLISLSSLLYFDILIADFRVTFAIVTMGVFLYIYRGSSPIIIGCIIAITTYFIRLLLFFIEFHHFSGMGIAYIPEMFFYLTYGIIIQYTLYKHDIHKLRTTFFIVIGADFLSNVVEVFIRIVFLNQAFSFSIFSTLLIVAIIRGFILFLLLNGIKIYRLLLIREEHELRYERLIHMTLLLKDEMYWFEKNQNKIESSMINAYNLFELLSTSEEDQLAEKSLSVASDIHEIKKEYELVLRGFKEITEEKYEISEMKFSDVFRILKTTIEYELNQRSIKTDIYYQSTYDFFTTKHFQLMSVLRNLISNSIDAVDGLENGKITVKHYKKNEMNHFIIEDNGVGISNKYLHEIFNPGYSTKIDYSTGEVNRGLGLSLVKDIIENQFKGSIKIESEIDKGTKFILSISGENLEG